MFCFQTSFLRRGQDVQAQKNFLSESENCLNKISYKPSCKCLSDPNLINSGVHYESEKWDKQKSNSQTGFDLLFKSESKCGIKKPEKSCTNTKNNLDVRIEQVHSDFYGVLTKNLSVLKKESSALNVKQMSEKNDTSLPSSLNYFQNNDIEFIDEPKTDGIELWERCDQNSKSLTTSDIKNVECTEVNLKSLILENQKSIININGIKSDVIESSPTTCEAPQNNKILVRSKSEQNLRHAQVMKHVSSDSGINCVINKKLVDRTCSNFQNLALKNFKEQIKTNSRASFLPLCSLFNVPKLSVEETQKTSKNNQTNVKDNRDRMILEQNLLNLSCCSLGPQQVDQLPVDSSKLKMQHSIENVVIINKSPKSKNNKLFSVVFNSEFVESRNGSWSSGSSPERSSPDSVAPIASPEVVSSSATPVFSHQSMSYSGHESSQDSSRPLSFQESAVSDVQVKNLVPQTKLKLMHEGDVQVCYLNHTRTIINKVLTSKLLRRWETHHIYLTDYCLCSRTPTGFLESPVPYSHIDEVFVVGRWDQRNRFCIRLLMPEGSLLLQASNPLIRDQWFLSILWKKNMHKYRNILQASKRPEVVLKEIKGLINSSLNSPLQDDCVTSVPIEIISKVLEDNEIWDDRLRTEEAIFALAPLLEDSTPTPEMFQFFSRHCLCHPRSPIVVDVFTAIVHRILKRTVDFGKAPLMRRFVADYLKALHSQNEGDEAVKKFVASIHGMSSGCPHPRVLPNLVAVNLAAVFSHFEQRKTLMTETSNFMDSDQTIQFLDKELQCFITLFLAISEFEDWRPGLAQLLQPIPFPDDALSHDVFITGFMPVIKKIGTDRRCGVHETVLGIRENKEGWLNVFCPSSLACKDEGVLWCQMLNTLFECCCRRKSFLQKMLKHLGALLLVALRNHAIPQEMLCLMLEWRVVTGEDQEMQVITTLQSTESGRQKYRELCKRQENLRVLQKEGGPKKLTLPSRSTDADFARLLSCGSFGNLECLSLAFTHVTSACAHQLIKLPALRYLNLWATQFGDAGLIVIADHLDKLQVLNLCETPVSDKGISAIAAMRNLKKLNLNSTKLSPQTLDILKQKLPTLQELDVRYTDAW